jgi:LAS superfamily LD-carboxypeptidase LdcB
MRKQKDRPLLLFVLIVLLISAGISINLFNRTNFTTATNAAGLKQNNAAPSSEGNFEFGKEDILIMDESKIVIRVNGSDISHKYPFFYMDKTVYVPALYLLEELGAITLEHTALSGVQAGSRALFAVTNDHTIRHTAATTEARVNEQVVNLKYPSILQNSSLYVSVSFFEDVSAAKVSVNVQENTVDLTAPAASQRLKDLLSQKQAGYYYTEYLFRYDSYMKKRSDLSAKTAIIYVNASLDKPFYSEIKAISRPDDVLVLCNKYNQLPKDYKPENLVHVTGGYYLRAEADAAYKEMIRDATQNGFSFQLKSAFRSFETQQTIYNTYAAQSGRAQADTYSARPGHSEHQTGLAIDITQPTGNSSLSSANFDKTPEFAWLSRNAHKYGFILRYPSDKTSVTGYMYEPWHYRYVGKEAAKHIYEQGLTLDEYVAMYRMKI